MSNDLMDDLDLDTPLSDIKSLISYSDPCNGTHIYALIFCGPDLSRGDNPVLGVSLVYQKLGTVEKAKESDMDSPIGSLFAENFTGHPKAKEILKMRITQFFGAEAMEEAEKNGQGLRGFINQLGESTYKEFYVQATFKSVTKGQYTNARIIDLQPVDKDSVKLPDGFEFYEYTPNLPE